MVSGKQKKAQLKITRKAKSEKRAIATAPWASGTPQTSPRSGEVAVGDKLRGLAPWSNAPEFIRRGTYRDLPFKCDDCGADQVWTATQQKWWYEVAGGGVQTTATRCRPCRAKERARKREARRVHLDGIARKRAARTKSKP